MFRIFDFISIKLFSLEKRKSHWVTRGLLIVLIVIIVFSPIWYRAARAYGDLLSFSPFIEIVIIVNQGSFPENEKELETKGLIRKTVTGGKTEYFIWGQGEWIRSRGLSVFDINYGIKADDIKARDGKLYDKISDEQVLLVNGPVRFLLRNHYESFSLNWYNLMLSESGKGNSVKKENDSPFD